MSLGNFFKDALPKVSGSIQQEISGAIGGAVKSELKNFSFSDVKTVLKEGYDKVKETFSTNPFSKLVGAAPSFDKLGAEALKGAIPSTSDFSLVASGEKVRLGAAAQLAANPTSATQIKEATGGTEQFSNTYHMVKLTSTYELDEVKEVSFEVMPEVTEVRSVEYEALAPPQLPGEFQKYKGTKSVQWTITGMFTARTREEAERNFRYMNALRGWTMPFFGEKQLNTTGGRLGAPPPVLLFSGWRGLVGQVPTVITNLSWSWPRDVDWLPTGILDEINQQEVPFPSVMNVTINLVESYSAEAFNNFDLIEFKSGRMIGAFSNSPRTVLAAPSVAEPTGGLQGIQNGVPIPGGSGGINSITSAISTAEAATNSLNVSSFSLSSALDVSKFKEQLGQAKAQATNSIYSLIGNSSNSTGGTNG